MHSTWAMNCAIRERTADGHPVGRCWFYVGEHNVCPRHGDVSEVQRHYLETGKLTDELDFLAEQQTRKDTE